MQRTFIIALFFGMLLMPLETALAQAIGSTPAPVQYTLAPENPGPDQLVDIVVQGVGSFLGNSTIIWKINGSTRLQGAGAREFTFTTGALGMPTVVSVTIESNDYGTITHQWTFDPSRIDLVWEANTSAPPFYKGRSLPSAGSQVTVIAFPEIIAGGKNISSGALSFQWKLDGTPEPNQSGIGFNTFSFTANQLHQNADVTVDVSSNGAAVGHGEAIIAFATPFIALYVHDPLRGVLYNSALTGTYTMPAIEETFRAEPYYFSNDSFAQGTLSYSWQLNNQDISGPNTAQGELTVRQTGGGAGNASLSVSLQNSDSSKLLQAAQALLSINFGVPAQAGSGSSSGSSNPFGL